MSEEGLLMPGLLSTPRPCLRGHGNMQEQPGMFALVGVNPRAMNPLAAAATHGTAQMTYDRSGQVYALRLWKCAVCNAVELVDEA